MKSVIKKRKVDVAIIGSGTAGMGAYRAAKKHTSNVVLIESSHYGTTCARVGCMPSKLLIAAAEAAHHARHADAFGVSVDQVKVDGKAVMKRVQKERDRFVGFVLESVDDFDSSDKLIGFAKFKDNHTLLVDDHTEITADRIVIATGSSPFYPRILKGADSLLISNDEIFELKDLPESVAVFGPGVIGLELGQALSRLGVRVKVFGRSGSLATLRDPDLKDYAENTFNEEFYLDSKAQVNSVVKKNNAVEVVYKNKAGEQVNELFSYALAATGRRPNVDSLGLENTSVELDTRGVPFFNRNTLQTNSAHIFIAGDVNNEITLLHEAADEGRIAGDNAGRFPHILFGKRSTALGVVFTEPQIANVGMNIHEVEEYYGEGYASGEVNFEGQGRSRVMLKNKGILKVYAEQGTGLFLGAEMFGPAAEHIAHLLSWAVQQKMTISEMLDMPFYHPVIEEGVRTALRDVNAKIHIVANQQRSNSKYVAVG